MFNNKIGFERLDGTSDLVIDMTFERFSIDCTPNITIKLNGQDCRIGSRGMLELRDIHISSLDIRQDNPPRFCVFYTKSS